MKNKNIEQIISQVREIFLLPENTIPKGKPNSYEITMSKQNNNLPHSIRYFNPDGYAQFDIDCDDHGNRKKHNYPNHNGAHKHIWTDTREDQESLTNEELLSIILRTGYKFFN